jgi:transposase InsO family protein
MKRQPFPSQSFTRTTRIGELIHSDIAGTINVPSLGNNRYVLTFTDDYSHYVTIYLLKFKSEALSHFSRTDNGGEYTSKAFELYLTSLGTIRQLTTACSPEQNGTAEKMNDILFNTCRALQFEANLSKTFWGEACHTAVYIRNRSPSSSIS